MAFNRYADLRALEKYAANPVLSKPPPLWNVTGWRDPFVFQDAQLDTFMDRIMSAGGNAPQLSTDATGDAPQSSTEERFTSETPNAQRYYYMLLGSGMHGHGGSVLLYVSQDLMEWDVMPMPLFHLQHNDTRACVPRGYQDFSFGYNWEVPNLIPFNNNNNDDQGDYLLFFGTEGNAKHLRGHHLGVWLVGTLAVRNDPMGLPLVPALTDSPYFPKSIEFIPKSCGLLDHGMLYAVNSVVVFAASEVETTTTTTTDNHPQPSSSSPLVMGWINEDWDIQDMVKEGFAGAMGAPRTISLMGDGHLAIRPYPAYMEKIQQLAREQSTLHNVSSVDQLMVDAAAAAAMELPPPLLPPKHPGQNNSNDNVLVSYLPIQSVGVPTRMLLTAHITATPVVAAAYDTGGSGSGSGSDGDGTGSGSSTEDSPSEEMVGIVLHHSCLAARPRSPDQHPWGEYTLVYYQPGLARLSVSRWQSSEIATANNDSLWMPVYGSAPSDTADSTPRDTATHSLDLQILLDHSVLEVFVNGRATLATRIYPVAFQDVSAVAGTRCNASHVGVVFSGGRRGGQSTVFASGSDSSDSGDSAAATAAASSSSRSAAWNFHLHQAHVYWDMDSIWWNRTRPEQQLPSERQRRGRRPATSPLDNNDNNNDNNNPSSMPANCLSSEDGQRDDDDDDVMFTWVAACCAALVFVAAAFWQPVVRYHYVPCSLSGVVPHGILLPSAKVGKTAGPRM